MSKPKRLSPTFSHAIIDPSNVNVFHASAWKGSGQSMTCTLNGNSRDGVQEQPNKKWINVDYDALPEVPKFFPIQRTSTVIIDCSEPCTVANRITDCLRKLSITAEFNSHEASLLAESLDHIMFHIRLFKNTHMSMNSKGILVEIQRLTGDSFNFIYYARDIIAAARGEVIVDERLVPTNKYIPSTSKSYCINNEFREPPESDEEYILHVEELLKNIRLDAVLLGIESLLVLTDREKSQVSSSMAEAVLRGDSGRSIIKNFISGCIHSNPRTRFPPEENTTFDYESRHSKNLHNTALAILANSLHTSAADFICSLLQSEEWMGQSGFIDALLSELSQAEYQSHNAYHAARCLKTLLDSSFEMRKVLTERGLSDVMKNSQRVGRRKHLLLAQECDAALEVLAQV